jgi:hypothetical protein
MIASTYDPQTGRILTNYAGDNPPSGSYVPGTWDAQRYQVKNGRVVELPPRPATYGYLVYNFDHLTQQWQLDVPRSTTQARAQRNQRLLAVDKVNPIWYADLVPDHQAELVEYRSALLAVPQQANFPEVIEWPAKPNWL